jgi:demethylmenaquinone methyltransferase/2-methoxy-6-polyprenyl-1,4-benzoquinol methylase
MSTTTEASGGSGAMFDRIAQRYDLLNRVLSLGLDRSWRDRAVRAAALGPSGRALDLATGTGDLAIAIASRHGDCTVDALDPSRGMLDIARAKLDAHRLAGRVRLHEGDAQRLPFDDQSFDAVTMAFGIRNVPDRLAALREIRRVLRPLGRAVILELAEPSGGVLGPLARWHVHHVVPTVGALLSGAWEYRYLQRSIAAFPAPDRFAALMREAGLTDARWEPMTFGAATLYVAQRGAAA